MAQIMNNKKGFKILRFSQEETYKLGWGIPDSVESKDVDGVTIIQHVGNSIHKGACLCCHCNNIIKEPIYYSAVLDDTFCEECYEDWLNNPKTINHPEDKIYEQESYNYVLKKLDELNIPYYIHLDKLDKQENKP